MQLSVFLLQEYMLEAMLLQGQREADHAHARGQRQKGSSKFHTSLYRFTEEHEKHLLLL